MSPDNESEKQHADLVFHPHDKDTYLWTRSHSGWIAGVCESLAPKFGINTVVMRALLVALTFISFGMGILLYLSFAIGMPPAEQVAEYENKRLLGVCQRLSQSMNKEIGLIRSLTILLAFASFGATALGYLALNFILPDEPRRL